MNILLLCHGHPNYVPDLFLHGLRKLFGNSVVDFPRKDKVYEGVLGQPFLEKIPGLMPSDEGVDRSDIATKLQRGFFDLVICDVRALKANLPLLSKGACRLALVDGEDQPVPLNPGRFALLRREKVWPDPSLPLPMGMPVEVIAWIDRYAETPKKHSIGFLGSRSKMTPDRNALLDALLQAFPDALVESWQYSSGIWQGRDAYYQNMQSCKIVLNLPGAGYDTFRYWENAACNAAHIAKRMPLIIPNDFREGQDITRFSSLTELIKSVEQILGQEDKWREFAASSRAWLLAHHTTERRAAVALDQLRSVFGS